MYRYVRVFNKDLFVLFVCLYTHTNPYTHVPILPKTIPILFIYIPKNYEPQFTAMWVISILYYNVITICSSITTLKHIVMVSDIEYEVVVVR